MSKINMDGIPLRVLAEVNSSINNMAKIGMFYADVHVPNQYLVKRLFFSSPANSSNREIRESPAMNCPTLGKDNSKRGFKSNKVLLNV